jgi:hypothetical protein
LDSGFFLGFIGRRLFRWGLIECSLFHGPGSPSTFVVALGIGGRRLAPLNRFGSLAAGSAACNDGAALRPVEVGQRIARYGAPASANAGSASWQGCQRINPVAGAAQARAGGSRLSGLERAVRTSGWGVGGPKGWGARSARCKSLLHRALCVRRPDLARGRESTILGCNRERAGNRPRIPHRSRQQIRAG